MEINSDNIQRCLKTLNRIGSRVILTDKNHDIYLMENVIVDSFTIILSTKKDTFWLLWKEIEYHNGNDYIRLSKIVHYEIDKLEMDEEDGEQRINVGFLDQEERLILVFGLDPKEDPNNILIWTNWQMFRDNHNTDFRTNDAKILLDRQLLAKFYDSGSEIIWKPDSTPDF